MIRHVRSRSARLRGVSLTAAGALLVALLPAGAASAQTAPDARDTSEVCDGDYDTNFDDIAGSVHEDLVRCMADLGLTDGTAASNGRSYAPRNAVTRAQMASFIARFIEAATGESLPSGPSRFDDVDSGFVHARNINALAQIGVTEGTASSGGDSFAPQAPVQRAQMASFIRRGLSYIATGDARPETTPAASSQDFFRDDDGSVHEANINSLTAAGIVQGFGDGTYRPGNSVFRDQMASFVMRSFAFIVDEGDVTPPPPPGEKPPPPPPATGVTDGPELVDVDVFNRTSSFTVLRYSFDEPVVGFAPSQFSIVRFDAQRVVGFATRLEVGNQNSVLVSYPNSLYDGATTASVDLGAVTDADDAFNPEGSRPLQSVSFDAGQTVNPNLVDVTNATVVDTDPDFDGFVVEVDFVFDTAVDLLDATGYSVVTLQNDLVDSDDVVAGDGTTTHTAQFDVEGDRVPAEFVNDLVRGIVDAGTVEDSEVRDRLGASLPNLARSAVISRDGETATGPNLDNVRIDRERDRMVFSFDREILVEGAVIDPAGFVAYSSGGAIAIGQTVLTTDNAEDIVVEFSDGAIDEQVTGGYVLDSTVISRTTDAVNRFQSAGSEAVAFAGGSTTAPDLEDVEFVASDEDPFTGATTEYTLRYTFDAAVEFGGAGQVTVYNEQGQRVFLDTDACTTDAEIVECVVERGDPTLTEIEFQLLGTGVLFGVTRNAVVLADGEGAFPYPNYATSLPATLQE